MAPPKNKRFPSSDKVKKYQHQAKGPKESQDSDSDSDSTWDGISDPPLPVHSPGSASGQHPVSNALAVVPVADLAGNYGGVPLPSHGALIHGAPAVGGAMQPLKQSGNARGGRDELYGERPGATAMDPLYACQGCIESMSNLYDPGVGEPIKNMHEALVKGSVVQSCIFPNSQSTACDRCQRHGESCERRANDNGQWVTPKEQRIELAACQYRLLSAFVTVMTEHRRAFNINRGNNEISYLYEHLKTARRRQRADMFASLQAGATFEERVDHDRKMKLRLELQDEGGAAWREAVRCFIPEMKDAFRMDGSTEFEWQYFLGSLSGDVLRE
ncbi:hypothetical protein F5Y15DRAFT_418395 [Xylariaceae sp. FL0016]|nr:hypothetical protein F5Y15DRAFT_418395 [Xylariaceae sp. FL0016]